MKVIFSANTSWYLYNFRKTTIQKFIAKGYDVHIISPDDDYTNKLIELGVKKHNLFLSGNSLNPILDAVTIIHLFILYFNQIKFTFSIDHNKKIRNKLRQHIDLIQQYL